MGKINGKLLAELMNNLIDKLADENKKLKSENKIFREYIKGIKEDPEKILGAGQDSTG